MSDWIQTKRQTHQATDTQIRERGGGGLGGGSTQNKTDKRQNAKTLLRTPATGVALRAAQDSLKHTCRVPERHTPTQMKTSVVKVHK